MKIILSTAGAVCVYFFCYGLYVHSDEQLNSDEKEYMALKKAIKENDLYIICLRKGLKGEDAEFQLDDVFSGIEREISERRKTHLNQHIFVIFSDGFFNKEGKLLDNGQVEVIVQRCREFTKKYRVLIQVNFWHKFNTEKCPKWLMEHAYKPLLNRHKIRKRIMGADTCCEICAKKILLSDKYHENRIANYTLTLYGQKIISIYRKSTYCNEANKEIIRNITYAYEFGDWKSHSVDDSPISKLFIGKSPMIVNRICSDMNEPHINNSSKLVIVQACDRPHSGYKNVKIPILFVDDKINTLVIIAGKTLELQTKYSFENDSNYLGYQFVLSDVILKDFEENFHQVNDRYFIEKVHGFRDKSIELI